MVMHVGVVARLKIEYPRTKTIRAKQRHESLFLILSHAHGVVDIGKFHSSSSKLLKKPRLFGCAQSPRTNFAMAIAESILRIVEGLHLSYHSNNSSVCQIQQHAIRVGNRVLAEFAAFEIPLARFTLATDGDFAVGRCRCGGGEIV